MQNLFNERLMFVCLFVRDAHGYPDIQIINYPDSDNLLSDKRISVYPFWSSLLFVCTVWN